MANMTVGSEPTCVTTDMREPSRLRKVTFTHTSAGTAGGSATTTFYITGTLLRYITTGGDAEWQFVLNDGTANIFSSGNLTATATSGVLNMHATVPHDGIPLVYQTLTCTTTNVTTAAPTITIIYKESD